MKKMIFSAAAFALVAVSSIALAPTTAEAIPAFARQTGAGCMSCHFQNFVALNPFGRAFKMGSFTDVGDQALIEDDDLSIPAVLNATFVIRAEYANENKTGEASTGTYEIPKDAVLMLAGRIGSNSGAFVEFDGGAANWQFLNSFDVSGFKVGIGAHKSGFGGSGVLELSNVFGQHGGKLGGKNISAIQNAGFTQDTTGIGAWVGNDLGYVQFALVAPAAATTGATNVGLSFGKLVRVVATLDVGGWDTLIGFGSVTGNAGKGDTAGNLAAVRVPMNMQFVDLQAQGELGHMSVGVYADWAHAKGETSAAPNVGIATGSGNFYGSIVDEAGNTVANTAGKKFDAFSIRGEIEPIERVLLGIGYGYKQLSQGVPGDITVKTFHLAATYIVYQNMELNVVFDSAKLNDPTAALASSTTRTVVLEVEALM